MKQENLKQKNFNDMNILITGANGQLGNEMRNVLSGDSKCSVVYTDVAELDLTNAIALEEFFSTHAIDVVVNCAAYTAVDAAEDNEKLCRLVNVEAVRLLATAAQKHGAKVIHVSTDYVFDGKGCRPYREEDTTCPQSVYGFTKLDGEKELFNAAPDSVVLRTAWLYSPYGKNFVKTMLTLGSTRDSLNVVVDQVGTPTYALDLALAIKAIIDAKQWIPGIYHFSDEGAISWYDFTKAIHRIAGLTTCNVSPCMSDQFPAKAARPNYSVLDKSKIKATYGITIPYWEDSLKHCINRINTDE